MSMALHNVVPLMELIKEMRECKCDIANMQPYVHCKVFEDNLAPLNLPDFQDSVHAPSILMCVTIIFVSMSEMA